jgi:hypothetical protein
VDDQTLMVSNIKNIYKDIKREKNNSVQATSSVMMRTGSA